MIFFYISLSTYICFNIIKYKQALLTLENQKYSIKNYSKWLFQNFKQIFLAKELFAIILLIITLNFNLKIIGVCTVIFYTIMFLLNFKNNHKIKLNSQTITRLVVITLIYIGVNIWFIVDYASYHYADIVFDNTAFYYIVLILMSYFSYFIVWLANLIARPFDRFLIKKKHRK